MSVRTQGESSPARLDISSAAYLLQGSREFLRMWANARAAEATCLVDPAALGADPALFGIALVDCVRHGARARRTPRASARAEALAPHLVRRRCRAETPTDLGKEVH